MRMPGKIENACRGSYALPPSKMQFFLICSDEKRTGPPCHIQFSKPSFHTKNNDAKSKQLLSQWARTKESFVLHGNWGLFPQTQTLTKQWFPHNPTSPPAPIHTAAPIQTIAPQTCHASQRTTVFVSLSSGFKT